MLMTVVFVRLVSLHQCRPTLESASNYIIIIIILDGFISDCMRIYCTSHDDIHLDVPARWISSWRVQYILSHTTLNAIQYYININQDINSDTYSDTNIDCQSPNTGQVKCYFKCWLNWCLNLGLGLQRTIAKCPFMLNCLIQTTLPNSDVCGY